MITVIAEIIMKPGRRDAVLEKINALLPSVLAEEGCHRYDPFTDFNGQIPWRKSAPDSVFMVEEWESLAHLEAHQQAAHMNKHRENIKADVQDVVINIIEKA
ncbi:MAG: antibiotic biosynthesis monooxygenase [Ewingella americana]|jgi:quinol monooxygenase YgiN|uniref:Quinol monooxygenase n=2 Tax=Ewingella americana TaxID=41202 RepID=A0A085G6N1_EWIA3|nr:putative quinol monooxygenase [Ewingella americana]KAA8727625.1 antibiotic biosynthesis monooxygenase [Ewingella americana]KFC79376.1 quinol monooxygenase [Ewingella americana ATCC 33852]MCI1679539.1 antibiotic biosynthesis monooxygenase [Ewingella americana]MCI1854866.1 antibiotic biosynthesis monooxygenase [Ewingella americana]MCI1861851.1 antibiotic biosynthesis monooxygenase [Ewingella americana]